MKYIINDKKVNMYDGTSIAVESTLPAAVYRLDFSPMSGHSLTRLDKAPEATKMYGGREKYLDRIDKTYRNFNRSLGILLSGGKGIGKTMFANHLIKRALDNDRPVVLVNGSSPNIEQAIDMLPEDTVVVFDEFEKNFSDDDDDGNDAQSNLLSLFDGQSAVKRLYVLTLNDTYHLSEYFIDRPGRFHYHLRFGNPKGDDIREYIKDVAPSVSAENIEKAVNYADLVDLTYDQLRAISWELEMGTPFEEILETINVPAEAVEQRYDLVFTRNGQESVISDKRLDPIEGGQIYAVLNGDRDSIRYEIADLKLRAGRGTGRIINMDEVESYMDNDNHYQGTPDETVIIKPAQVNNNPLLHQLNGSKTPRK